ncbi:MAG: hypothetical protein K9I29_01295 [Bacteroidales bacterium]|nr:hypothetical protein [Bacteroidales bacterium]MCF8326904.1 hypothetical protein [Bacteroidales bacterium]
MKKYFLVIILGLFCSNFLNAQNAKELKKQGLQAYENGRFNLAINYLEEAQQAGAEGDTVLFVLAEAKRQVYDCRKALDLYLELINTTKDKFPEARFYAGLMYKCQKHYEKASEQFLAYSLTNDKTFSDARVSEELKSCSLAVELIKDSLAVKIEQPGKNLNSSYTDFGAVQLSNGKIYFSSLRPTDKSGSSGIIPKAFQTDIYISRISAAGYEPAKVWNASVNKRKTHTANINFSHNEERIYFTRCNRVKNEMICQLFVSEKEGENWSKPEKLPASINAENATTTHPFHTVTSGQEVLYFASDRRGGHGGMDIWYSIIQDDDYTTPVNLGSTINKEGDEITPFYDQKDSVLYFSSDWHAGLGGFDIFSSKGGFASWTEPENIGYPLNSPANDLYFSINNDEYSGYITSNRVGSYFITNQNCCNDIFYYEFLPEDEDTATTPQPDSVDIVINRTKQLLPLMIYFDNDIPVPAETEDTTTQRVDELLESYTQQKDTYLKNYIRKNSPRSALNKKRMQAFFDTVRRSKMQLDSLVDSLYKILHTGQDIFLVVRGYASPLTNEEYNLKLSKRRIIALTNYLEEAKDQKLSPFIRSNDSTNAQLKIYSEPMGEVTNQNISDNPADKRNSVYSMAAAKSRKIVINDVKKSMEFADADFDIRDIEVDKDDLNLRLKRQNKSQLYKVTVTNNSSEDVFIENIETDKFKISHYIESRRILAGEQTKLYFQIVSANNREWQEKVKIYFYGNPNPLTINVSVFNPEK